MLVHVGDCYRPALDDGRARARADPRLFLPVIDELHELDDVGCRYLDDYGKRCGSLQKPGSAYCPKHDAVCYVAEGSPGYKAALRTIGACAKAGAKFVTGTTPPR
jgi:hypothetical protein